MWHPEFLENSSQTASFFNFVEAKNIQVVFLSASAKGLKEKGVSEEKIARVHSPESIIIWAMVHDVITKSQAQPTLPEERKVLVNVPVLVLGREQPSGIGPGVDC